MAATFTADGQLASSGGPDGVLRAHRLGQAPAVPSPSAAATSVGFVSRYVQRAVAAASGGQQNPTIDRDNPDIRIALPVIEQ